MNRPQASSPKASKHCETSHRRCALRSSSCVHDRWSFRLPSVEKLFTHFPSLAAEIDDDELLRAILDVATEIARRSAKHSAEFLNAGSTVSRELKSLQNSEVTAAALALSSAFAARAGGIAADAWAVTPAAIAELSATNAIRLLKSANDFLERGGGAALHVLIAGGEILRRAPEIFDEWIALLGGCDARQCESRRFRPQ